MLPHHPEQVLHWALRKETMGKGGREEMEVPVCYLQRASQWLVSVRLAGRRGEFTEQHTAAAQSGRGGSRRRECVHRRDKRSPSVQRQGEIEKNKAWGVSHCPRDSQCQSEGGRRENGGRLSWIHISDCQPALCSSRLAGSYSVLPLFPSKEIHSVQQVQKPFKSTVS